MTIREWIDTLPSTVRDRALANTVAMEKKDGDDILTRLEPSLYHALSGAFYWEHTPEGHNYWSAFANAAKMQSTAPMLAKEENEDNS